MSLSQRSSHTPSLLLLLLLLLLLMVMMLMLMLMTPAWMATMAPIVGQQPKPLRAHGCWRLRTNLCPIKLIVPAASLQSSWANARARQI